MKSIPTIPDEEMVSDVVKMAQNSLKSGQKPEIIYKHYGELLWELTKTWQRPYVMPILEQIIPVVRPVIATPQRTNWQQVQDQLKEVNYVNRQENRQALYIDF